MPRRIKQVLAIVCVYIYIYHWLLWETLAQYIIAPEGQRDQWHGTFRNTQHCLAMYMRLCKSDTLKNRYLNSIYLFLMQQTTADISKIFKRRVLQVHLSLSACWKVLKCIGNLFPSTLSQTLLTHLQQTLLLNIVPYFLAWGFSPWSQQ